MAATQLAEKVPFLLPTSSIDSDGSGHDEVERCIQHHIEERRRRKGQCVWAVFLVCACCLSAILGAIANVQLQDNSMDRLCLRRTSRESPIAADVEIKHSTIGFNGSLLKENIYRQKGGPDVDAAWEELGINYRSVLVSADDAKRAGLQLDQVRVRRKYGGGYPANVEGLHQLHCLNLVRQALFYNVEYYRGLREGAFQNNEYILQKHVSHCLDIVRQQLMCSVDVGVMGQVWFQPSSADNPEAYVDFNTKHVCRNFEDVRQWAQDHQMPAEVPEDFLEPPREGDCIYFTIP